MKLAILIIHRGDRPYFHENLVRMIQAQTLQPDHIEDIGHKPENDDCDITKRYRLGYERLSGKGFDLIAFMEVDDWYSPVYLESMVRKWESIGKPQLFGTSHTIYYHLLLKKHYTMEHFFRSSAMNTLIKPDMEIQWCNDKDPYTDVHLWRIMHGRVFQPDPLISLGIKHGVGKSGGKGHVSFLHRYKFSDLDIEKIMDKESFQFYSTYFEKHPEDLKVVKEKLKQNSIIVPDT